MKNISNELKSFLNRYRQVCYRIYTIGRTIDEMTDDADCMYIGAAINTGMPHGYDVSNPTERKGLRSETIDLKLRQLFEELKNGEAQKADMENEMLQYISEDELDVIYKKECFRMTFEVIGLEKQTNLNTVKARYFNGLKKLEKLFGKNV